ncbi:MAG: hypothetical protein ACE5IP_05545 [Terriglobia bacterium]
MIQRRRSSWTAPLSILLVLLIGLPVAARPSTATTDESDWSNLQQLRIGQEIEVVDTNLKKHKGTFLSLSEEAISLRAGKDEVAVTRPNVFRVSSREHSKRLRNTLIGLAIGGGIGVAVGAIGDAQEGEPGEHVGAGVFGLLGGGIGAGLGAALPSHQTIYKAKK